MAQDPQKRCYVGHVLEGFEMREFNRIGLCEQCKQMDTRGFYPIRRGRLAAEYRRSMRDVDPNDEHIHDRWSE